MKYIMFFILIVISFENCSYYHYFDDDNKYKCTQNYSCPNEYKKLIPNKNECTNDCKSDDIYKYEFKYECYQECPEDTELINDTYCSEICTEDKPYQNILTHECLEFCSMDEVMKKICVEYGSNVNWFDKLVEDIKKMLSSINISDFENEDENPFITFTSTKPEKSSEIFIFLNDCEVLLKQYYHIPDYDHINFQQISGTEFEASYNFGGSMKAKLDMSICNDLKNIEIINETFIECNIKQPFENVKTQECVEKCDLNDLFNETCVLNFQIDENENEINSKDYYEFQNLMMKHFEDIITSEQFFNLYLNNLDFQDSFLKSGEMKLTLTTQDNQMYSRDFEKETTIDLGECQNKIKSYYNLNSIYLKKIDISEEGMKIPKIYYDIFGELNNSNHLVKLNKSICEEERISLFIPFEIKENIDIYNFSSGYYNDICYIVASDDGIDLALEDRRKIYLQENHIICQDDCDFIRYDKETQLVECSCKVKESSLFFEDLKIDKIKLYHNYEYKNENQKNIFNLKVLTCNVLNSKENIKSNIGFYILLLIIVIFIIILVLFYCKGYDWLKNKMDEIIQKKFDKAPINNISNNNIIKKDDNHPKKANKSNKNKNNEQIQSLTVKNNNSNNILMNGTSKRNMNIPMNITSVFEQQANMNVNMNNKNQIIIQPVSFPETDYELNWLSYYDALIYDRRNFNGYYSSLIREKQLFIFSFFYVKDYNSSIIKKYIIFLSFAFHYTINAFFFSDSILHQIYIDRGKFQIIYQIPQIFYSSIISTYLVRILVRTLALTNKDVLDIKFQRDKNTAIYMEQKKYKYITIKFIIFFSLNFLLLGFFWYYLTCFNAIYKNNQTYLLENTIISFAFSLCFPFLINIVPAMLRNCSLHSANNNNGYCYKISQITQLF